MNDPPTRFCAAKNQGEATVRLVAGALEMPAARYDGSVFA